MNNRRGLNIAIGIAGLAVIVIVFVAVYANRPAEGEPIFSGNDMKFAVDGSVVKVYAGDKPYISSSQDYILLRIQAPPSRGACPASSELYVNGMKKQLRDSQWSN